MICSLGARISQFAAVLSNSSVIASLLHVDVDWLHFPDSKFCVLQDSTMLTKCIALQTSKPVFRSRNRLLHQLYLKNESRQNEYLVLRQKIVTGDIEVKSSARLGAADASL